MFPQASTTAGLRVVKQAAASSILSGSATAIMQSVLLISVVVAVMHVVELELLPASTLSTSSPSLPLLPLQNCSILSPIES